MRMLASFMLVITATTMIHAQSASKQIIKVGPDAGLPFSPAVKAGGLIYVSGTVAVDASGKVNGNDIKAQTKQTLDNLATTLKAAGSSMANVASVMVYLKSAADFAAMNEVYRTYWSKDPPVRTTVAAPLALPDALVEISMIAIPEGGERVVVHPADWLQSPNPYSYGIKTGNTLFLSGLVSRNGRDNSVVKGDVTTQTKTVLDNAGAILKQAGMSYGDVVSARVFITDTAGFGDMNTAYRSYFKAAPPARATVRAGLMSTDYLVEITMLAVKDASRAPVATPNADGTPAAANPNLSAAIHVGNRLYLSGMLGADATTKGDVKAQTTETLARLGRTLKAAGFDWPHVVEGMVYLTDVSRFADMNGAYRQVLQKDFPARTTIGAGLMNADGLVEIMMTAVK
jgi:reactive intermediate/imine deaminase